MKAGAEEVALPSRSADEGRTVSEGATSAHPWRYRGAVLAVFAAFNLVTFNRYFPLSEGWWETYGYLWNSGLRPYRDFDLAFTPLFTMLNAGLLRVFGESFFAIRLFGVGVFLVAVLVLELLLERFFSPRTAAVAVTVATFLVIFETQFIAKDYHVYQLVLVGLALLLHVELSTNARLTGRRRLALSVLLGVTAALVFLLKQNVGGLLLVGIAASIAVVAREHRWARLLAFGLGVALALLLALPIVSPSEWRQLLLANDAKGSIGTVLGRVWRLDMNRAALKLALELGVTYAILGYVFAPPWGWRGVLSDPVEAFVRHRLVRGTAFFAVVLLVAVSGNRIRHDFMPWIIPGTLALLGLATWRMVRGVASGPPVLDARLAAIVPPAIALAYANTTTAGFDFNGLHVVVALAIGWVLAAVEAWAPPRHWGVAALVFLIIVPEIVAQKLRIPYEWWGHRQAAIWEAKAESTYPELRGVYVTPQYRDTLDTIKRAVETYSLTRSDAYFYNLPFLYWFHRKLPPHRTVVQWFDVVSSRQMETELHAVREQPPRIVVALEPPPVAFTGARELKMTDRLPQEAFRDLLDGWVASGRFRLIRSIALRSERLGGREETQEILVQNEASLGVAIEEILAAEGAGGLEVRGVARRGARVAPGVPLEAGDVVTVAGNAARVQTLADRLGVGRSGARGWHTVNIYVRADAAGARPEPAPR